MTKMFLHKQPSLFYHLLKVKSFDLPYKYLSYFLKMNEDILYGLVDFNCQWLPFNQILRECLAKATR